MPVKIASPLFTRVRKWRGVPELRLQYAAVEEGFSLAILTVTVNVCVCDPSNFTQYTWNTENYIPDKNTVAINAFDF